VCEDRTVVMAAGGAKRSGPGIIQLALAKCCQWSSRLPQSAQFHWQEGRRVRGPYSGHAAGGGEDPGRRIVQLGTGKELPL